MTEPSHPSQTRSTQTSAARSVSVKRREPAYDVMPLTDTTTSTDTTTHPGTTTDLHSPRASVRPDRSGILFVDALPANVIQALSTRHLRVLANQAYHLMNTDGPPAGVAQAYELIVDELDVRAEHATRRAPRPQLKETFRDNPLYGRFELLIDSQLAVYVNYRMTGAHVALTEGVEQPGFRDQGIDETLMHHIVLNAHIRCLNLMPQCPIAFSYLADHPQYQVLTAQPTHQTAGT
jgi:predicted GNAT family acetyltransferase